MFKKISLFLALTSAAFADGFNPSLTYNPYRRIPSMIEEGLRLGQVEECEETESSENNDVIFDIEPLAETSTAAARSLTKEKEDKTNVNFSFEVLSPAFRKRGVKQRRTTISFNDLHNAFNMSSIGTLTDQQLAARFRLNVPQGASESNLEYATRTHLAVTTVRAAELGKTNPNEALRYIRAKLKGKSFKAKVKFMGLLAGRMLKNYDYAKTVDNGDSPDDSLWAAMDKNHMAGTFFDKAGVCRHIHQLSVKIARQVGVKMSYGLSYASPTGYHLTAIMTNPNNPLETVRVNYANIESAHGDDGSAAIAQKEGASINSGIAYHVWDDDDTPLYYFANQKGVILEHHTGGDISLLDPNVRYEAGGVHQTTQINDQQIRVFHALHDEVEGGEHVMGVSHYTEVPLSEHFSVSVGSALYASSNNPVTIDHRDKSQSGSVTQQSNQGYGFYVRPTFKAEVNPLEGLRLRSQLILRATGYFNNNTRTTKTYANGSVTSESSNPMLSTFLGDGNGSLVSDITYTRGDRSRTMLQWDISGQVSNIAATNGFELYLRRVGISHDENFDLGFGRLQTNTSFNLVPLNNGVNPIIASGGVSFLPDGGRQLYSLGFTGSLNPESTPAFIPGARPAITFSAEHQGRLLIPLTIGVTGTYGPSITMTGSRIVDSVDSSGNGLIDHYQYVEGGMPAEIELPQQEIQRENYRFHIPHNYFVQFYLKGHF